MGADGAGGEFRFLNEYGELETPKPVDRAEALAGAAVGPPDAGVVSSVSFLASLFVLTVENG